MIIEWSCIEGMKPHFHFIYLTLLEASISLANPAISPERIPDPDNSTLVTSVITPDWHPLGPGIDGGIFTIAISGNDVYVGGAFLNAGGNPDADYIARWDGCEWHALGGGLNEAVYDIEIDGSNIYASGAFTAPVSHIGFWDGMQWNELGLGLNATVLAIEIEGPLVYAGGLFTDAGGNGNADYVASWNGSDWENLGTPLNHTVSDIEVNGQFLYVLGNFTDAGGNAQADYIAGWDGSTWFPIGTGLEPYPPFTVFSQLELHGYEVWVGGNLGVEGDPGIHHLAHWDGLEWTAVDVLGTPSAVKIVGDELYFANGATDCASLWTLNLLSQLWEIIPGCLETFVYAFAITDNDLYAGGSFWATPPYTGCPYCNIMRLGEAAGIPITGVPSTICSSDPPILLPTTQNGYVGTWTGTGVTNNEFDPYNLEGNITIAFIPDQGGCMDSVNVIITVTDCSAIPAIDWIWARAISGDPVRGEGGVPYAYDVVADSASNASYTVGYFYGSVDFNPGAAEHEISPLGALDGFIVKLTATGDFEWAKQIGGPGGGVIAYAVTTDAAGNIFITGGFSSEVDFDPGAGVHTVYSLGESDVFILKLNAAGQFQWVKQFGYFLSTCWGANIAVDQSSGNIYTTGTHSGECDFDPGSGYFILGNTDQQYNIFVSKLDSNGNFGWAKEIQGVSAFSVMQGTSIAVDAMNENVYICGQFYGTCDFDTGYWVDSLTSNGESDIFVLKLDSAGNYAWSNQVGGVLGDCCPSIAVGKSGNEKIYLSGAFTGTVDFDPGPGVVNLLDGGLFTCKLDSAGQLEWARAIDGAGGVNSYSGSYLCVDTLRNENVILCGAFAGASDFDPGPDAYILNAAGLTDVFVAKMDSAGNFLLAKSAGGLTYEVGIAGALDSEGKIIVAGHYDSSSLPFDNDTLANVTDPNVFIAKAGGCTTRVTNTGNNGPGSLRDVIACAQSGDVIEFSLPPLSEITLTSGEISIDKHLTISGPGMNTLTLSGNNNSRIFYVLPGISLSIADLTLKNGSAIINGGAVFNRGDLFLRNILLENNFQGVQPKSLTLVAPGSLHNNGLVEMRF